MRQWVATFAKLPDRVGWLVLVDGQEVALFRLGERVYAIDNDCPHRGGALAFGDVRGEEVHCPLHAWAFHLPSGTCPEFPGVSVRSHAVEVEGGEVYLTL